MEYVEGDHLGGLLSGSHKLGERIPVPIVLRVMMDALAGLGAAHDLRDDAGNKLNIVHRDVSPHNILVGRDGIGRLTDFGVAKAEGRLTHTRDGQVKGKLAYMAPEQASSGATDSRSDLFSAGIILWECVTGRRLFRADNTAATLVKLLSEPIALPSAIDSELAPLDPVLKKALERDPAARFQTAEEFIEAIEWVAGRMGGVASPRAVTKAVKQYAAEKLARERKMIAAAQRTIRGVSSADLFNDTDPSMPAASSEVSLWSASMSRSKPTGANVTAPRLFTRARTQRATTGEESPPPIAVPPPLGTLSDSAMPPALDSLAGDELDAPPASPLRALLIALLIAAAAVAVAAAWFSVKGPARLPEPRVHQLPPRANSAAPGAPQAPPPEAVTPPAPPAAIAPPAPPAPPEVAAPVAAPGALDTPAATAPQRGVRTRRGPVAVEPKPAPAAAPPVVKPPATNTQLLPNPYTR
jgi:serine/threonine-protein kinase